ncbi:YqaJ viral recombinase family protein [Cupriavidus gilardii]|uniref:YqaJ viral recombinase family protein n=1 Tax=Cupriavidus gilardii TaxID=82541 RepID=UPI0021C09478|nr:YqaJ viral recombinase family protein [Cupriavidus gilardii]MCT9071225.1 YqaJ viral recombinase family protein [Cupriavidus gilardii]
MATVGGIEIKSPHDEGVHINTWLNGMPEEHMPQVQGNMLVTGRQWWDFISYDPQCRWIRFGCWLGSCAMRCRWRWPTSRQCARRSRCCAPSRWK